LFGDLVKKLGFYAVPNNKGLKSQGERVEFIDKSSYYSWDKDVTSVFLAI